MTIPEFPTARIARLTRRLMAAGSAAVSPFTGTAQVQDWGGRWWVYEIDCAVMSTAEGRALAAFLAALGGGAGRFLLADPSAQGRAPAGLAIAVDGSGQSGSLLATDGWQAGAPALAAGDFLSLGTGADTRLHQVTADAIADGAGKAALTLVPPLRFAPADGAPVEIAAPKVLLRLTAPAAVPIERPERYRIALSAREAI